MNSIVENLLKEMEKCNFKNNRCDYLLEHSEIDYLLEYIDQLQQEIQKYKEVIEKLKDAIKECWYMDSENIGEQVFLKKIELQNILKEV